MMIGHKKYNFLEFILIKNEYYAYRFGFFIIQMIIIETRFNSKLFNQVSQNLLIDKEN